MSRGAGADAASTQDGAGWCWRPARSCSPLLPLFVAVLLRRARHLRADRRHAGAQPAAAGRLHGARQPRPRAPSTGSPPTPSISSRPKAAACSIFVTLPAGDGWLPGCAALVVGALSLRTQRLLLPDGDARLRADGVLPVPRHQARRRHRRRLSRPARCCRSSTGELPADRAASGRSPSTTWRSRCWSPCISASSLLLRSLFGRVLEGIRVNEHRMQALGFDTYRYKLAAFVIAGMLAGVAGTCGPCTAAS